MKLLLASALAAAVSAADSGNLRLLSDYPDAVCLDGTPGAYYVSPGANPSPNK
jgi:hypothetical protein